MQVMVIPDRRAASQSSLSTRQSLKAAFSTKVLEPSPGDMLRDPAMVYAQAEETAKRFRSTLEHAEALAPGQQPDVAQRTETAAEVVAPEGAAQMVEKHAVQQVHPADST